MLFVEHDMEIVERYARRVLAFYDGRVIADGRTAEALASAGCARPPLSFAVGDLASNGLDRCLLLPDGREIIAISDARRPG